MTKGSRQAQASRDSLTLSARDRRDLVQQRVAFEAALLAYRGGWRRNDEIRVERLHRGLRTVLDALGTPSDPAHALLEP